VIRAQISVWAVALAASAFAGVAGYLWGSATTSASQCSTGTGGSNWGLLTYALLVLAAPLTTGVYGRYRQAEATYIPVITSLFFLAPTAVFFGALANGCMT
jgi:hypothetical protein